MSDTRIGWIGLGNMGIPMSRQLLKAGYPVTVYNRSREKQEVLRTEGPAIAADPADLLRQSDVAFVMVSDDRAIRDVFTAEGGLLSANTGGRIIVNMSTVSPGISVEMAARCREQGNAYLDAPVSGSVRQAEEGQLVVMVGGEESTFERARPVLERLGKLVMRVGDHGAGNAAKLAINALLAIHAQGLAEAVAFARQQGIATEALLTLINNSALGSVFTKIKGDAILNDNYRAAFALKHLTKDLRLAGAEGLATPLAEAARQTFGRAEATLGEEDVIAILKQLSPQ